MPKPNSGRTVFATHDDVQGILGNIDPEQMLAIMSLQPTIADIEEASVCTQQNETFRSIPLQIIAFSCITVLKQIEADCRGLQKLEGE